MTEEVPAHSELPPSSADKWFHCHAWRRLTHGIEDTSSAAAEEGTIAHAWLADHLLKTRDLTDCPDPEMYDLLMACVAWVEEQPGERHVETRVDFGGPFGFVDLTGTSDLIFVTDDDLTIADLKYGRGMVEAGDNLQLLTYLVGAVYKFGRRDMYRMAILQPRAWHQEGPIRETWITDDHLRQFERDLERAIKANYSPKSEAKVGPWCRHFCKALPRCQSAAQHSIQLFRDTPIEDDE